MIGETSGVHGRIALSPTEELALGIVLNPAESPRRWPLINTASGKPSVWLDATPHLGWYFMGCRFSKDGKRVAVATGDLKRVCLCETHTGRLVQSLEMKEWVSCVAFNPDGSQLAAGRGHYDEQIYQPRLGFVYPPNVGTIHVWDLATGKNVFPPDDFPISVWDVAYSPDGRLLAAAMGNANQYDFSGNSGGVRVWDTKSWRLRYTLRGHSRAFSVSFDPSGKRLISGGGDLGVTGGGEVIIWDLETGNEVWRFRDKLHSTYGAEFSPDGRRIAMVDDRGRVTLLDGTPIAETPVFQPLRDNQ